MRACSALQQSCEVYCRCGDPTLFAARLQEAPYQARDQARWCRRRAVVTPAHVPRYLESRPVRALPTTSAGSRSSTSWRWSPRHPAGASSISAAAQGSSTALLHRQLDARETVGIDSSEAMLARSAAYAAPGLRFEHGDIAAFHDAATVDLVFSNAALHWLPDHPALFARLTATLRPGGQLAVQMPANHDHPTHVVAAELAPEFGIERTRLAGATARGAMPRSSMTSATRASTSACRSTPTTSRRATTWSSG